MSKKIRLNKISLEELKNKLTKKWSMPKSYKLYFPISMKCRYCKKHFHTKIVTIYDRNCICNCTNCGGRYSFTIDDLEAVLKKRKTNKIIYLIAAIAIFILLLILFNI